MSLFPLALALLLSSQPTANHGDPATAAEVSESEAAARDWSSIDRELAELTRSWQGQGSDINLGGRLIALYAHTSDPFFTGTTGEDISGFDLRSARLNFSGQLADYEYLVMVGAGDGTARIRDAWVAKELGDESRLTLGQYRTPFLYSGMMRAHDQLFLERNLTGADNNNRTIGAMASGSWYDWNWWGSVQNGLDDDLRDWQLTWRLTFDILGQPFDTQQGSRGSEETSMGLGFAWTFDHGISSGQAGGLDFEWANGAIYFAADMVAYDDDYDRSRTNVIQGRDPGTLLGNNLAGTTPYALTLAYLMGGNDIEATLRYENVDDDEDSSRVTVGLNWYSDDLGNVSKWQINYVETVSDDDALEGGIFQVGYVITW